MNWYNFRRPKGAGPFFVLLLNLLIFSYQQNGIYDLVNVITNTIALSKADPWVHGLLNAILADCLPKLLYPFAGWLADAKLGRYKVMRVSMWIMWVVAVLLLATSILSYISMTASSSVNTDHVIKDTLPVVVVIYIISAIGIAGFHANLIPFGIDQMEDCSAEEISSFVYWYYWTGNVNFGIIIQSGISSSSYYCSSNNITRDSYDLVISLIQIAFLTSAICLDMVFSKKLNKDPKIHNPIKKVKDISTFVFKHKQAVGRRSAYTYTYDTPPVRSDFAKVTYGGYFEDDDVEDVIAFWRIVVFMATIGFGVFLIQSVSLIHMQLHSYSRTIL